MRMRRANVVPSSARDDDVYIFDNRMFWVQVNIDMPHLHYYIYCPECQKEYKKNTLSRKQSHFFFFFVFLLLFLYLNFYLFYYRCEDSQTALQIEAKETFSVVPDKQVETLSSIHRTGATSISLQANISKVVQIVGV